MAYTVRYIYGKREVKTRKRFCPSGVQRLMIGCVLVLTIRFCAGGVLDDIRQILLPDFDDFAVSAFSQAVDQIRQGTDPVDSFKSFLLDIVDRAYNG